MSEILNKDINQFDENHLRQGYWEYYWNDLNADDWEQKYCKKIRCRGNYVDDKENGYWEWFWANGSIWIKATYVNKRPKGMVTFYADNLDNKIYLMAYHL